VPPAGVESRSLPEPLLQVNYTTLSGLDDPVEMLPRNNLSGHAASLHLVMAPGLSIYSLKYVSCIRGTEASQAHSRAFFDRMNFAGRLSAHSTERLGPHSTCRAERRSLRQTATWRRTFDKAPYSFAEPSPPHPSPVGASAPSQGSFPDFFVSASWPVPWLVRSSSPCRRTSGSLPLPKK